MFIGRDKEMTLLEELYASTKFEFLVLYGRRRVGKTSLLVEFIKKHKAIFFSAQEKNGLSHRGKAAWGLHQILMSLVPPANN